jgi:hypothetical protein
VQLQKPQKQPHLQPLVGGYGSSGLEAPHYRIDEAVHRGTAIAMHRSNRIIGSGGARTHGWCAVGGVPGRWGVPAAVFGGTERTEPTCNIDRELRWRARRRRPSVYLLLLPVRGEHHVGDVTCAFIHLASALSGS